MSTRNHFALSLVLKGCLAPVLAAVASGDQIFTDGFDGPKWFIDADSDGYGDPATFVHSLSQPQGYVANALDCNDSDQAIHPGATDDPDANFIDRNCDGIDGDVARAIFVGTSGVDGPSCGTQVNPCHSPAYAITRLDLQHTQIYVQVGTYSGAFTIGSNAAFYGGYDASWQRGPVTAGGPNARFAGSIAAMGTHGAQAHAVYVPGGVQAVLAEIEIDAPNTTARSNGNGSNSYALYADQNANVQLSRDRIVAATAADGAAGSPGVDAAQDAIATGIAGGPGMEYSSACDATSHGVGGAASTNSCASGRSVVAGKGGDGGVMDTSCDVFGGCTFANCTAAPGAPGNDADVVNGTMGKGGTGGTGSGSCGPTQAGFAGDVNDGSGGLKGTGSLLIDGQWSADAGGSGTLGDNGGGGGGGGGAGGCDTGIDSYGAGGGGGGAGGCAAAGAGSGGGGGGGSFGVFAYSATAAIDNSVIVLGEGGSGGKGGVAGIGQPGGAGGSGGLSNTLDAPAGGKGGDGGRGGVAGGGGGGQGGIAFGIYSFNSTITNVGNTFQGGVAGPGGTGGTSSVGAGAGETGQAGVVGNVGTCASELNC